MLLVQAGHPNHRKCHRGFGLLLELLLRAKLASVTSLNSPNEHIEPVFTATDMRVKSQKSS